VGIAFLSLTATVATASAANREYVLPINSAMVIDVPVGVTTLNATGSANSVIVYIVQVEKDS
jgi:hypothetical protein